MARSLAQVVVALSLVALVAATAKDPEPRSPRGGHGEQQPHGAAPQAEVHPKKGVEEQQQQAKKQKHAAAAAAVQRTFSEIVDTENNYIAQLAYGCNMPNHRAFTAFTAAVTAEDANVVQKMVHIECTLQQEHAQLLAKLQSYADKGPAKVLSSVPKALAHFIAKEEIKALYTEFSVLQDRSMNLRLAPVPDFRNAFQALDNRLKGEAGNALIAPVQRLMRYRMLVEDLGKAAQKADFDPSLVDTISHAISTLKAVAAEINAAVPKPVPKPVPQKAAEKPAAEEEKKAAADVDKKEEKKGKKAKKPKEKKAAADKKPQQQLAVPVPDAQAASSASPPLAGPSGGKPGLVRRITRRMFGDESDEKSINDDDDEDAGEENDEADDEDDDDE